MHWTRPVTQRKVAVWSLLCHLLPTAVGASTSLALVGLQHLEWERKMAHRARGNWGEFSRDCGSSRHRGDKMSVGFQKSGHTNSTGVEFENGCIRHSHAVGTWRECSLEPGPASWLATCDEDLIPHLSPPPWRKGEAVTVLRPVPSGTFRRNYYLVRLKRCTKQRDTVTQGEFRPRKRVRMVSAFFELLTGITAQLTVSFMYVQSGPLLG